jgi:hypothetical protein
MLGIGNANAIFTASGTLSDTTQPCLALNYSLKPQKEESPSLRKQKATVQAAVGTGTLVITITIPRYTETGAATTDMTYVITGAASKVAWATANDIDYTASALTMKDVVDLLNEIDGMQAYVLHCPHSLSVNNNDYIALSETDIPVQPAKYLSTLYRDVSEAIIDTDKKAFFLRLGNPEARDAGSLKLVGLDVLATGTTPRVRLYRDDIRNFDAEYSATFATEQANKQMYVNTIVATDTQTEVVDHDLQTALTYQSPLLLVVDATDLSACTATIKVQQASI